MWGGGEVGRCLLGEIGPIDLRCIALPTERNSQSEWAGPTGLNVPVYGWVWSCM